MQNAKEEEDEEEEEVKGKEEDEREKVMARRAKDDVEGPQEQMWPVANSGQVDPRRKRPGPMSSRLRTRYFNKRPAPAW